MSNKAKNLSLLYNAMKNQQLATIKEYQPILQKTFKSAGVSEAQSSADLILASAIGRKTLSGVDPNTPLTLDALARVRNMIKKRIQHMPLQYVISEWDFCQLTFAMEQPVFIPRPETEELVGLALTDQIVQNATNFIEVGCGSGVISTILLKLLPQTSCTAIDVNPNACLLTKQNAMRHNVADRLSVVNCSWREYLERCDSEKVTFDFLISNPPYISTYEIERLQPEILWFEDRRALDGGLDGMNTVREIIAGVESVLKSHGSVWLEVDHKHPEMIKDFVERSKSCNLNYVKSHADFTHRLRFCHLSAV